jgi:hypothetical protein
MPFSTRISRAKYHINRRRKSLVRGKALALVASVLLVAGIGVATAAPAHAQTQICTIGGLNNNGDCMNNWFGKGPVYAYLPNKSNENFSVEYEYRCSTPGGLLNADFVTGDCPFTNQSMDDALLGDPILQIVYGQNENNGCVADPHGTGYASLGGCNTGGFGIGGAFSSLWVVAKNHTLVSVDWSNQERNWWQLNSNGGSEPLTIFGAGSNGTEWG